MVTEAQKLLFLCNCHIRQNEAAVIVRYTLWSADDSMIA